MQWGWEESGAGGGGGVCGGGRTLTEMLSSVTDGKQKGDDSLQG